jgi:coenzyme Q-binding protein COQ10
MRRYSAERPVKHSAREMFDLVADVEAYPEFLPFCEALEVTERETDDAGREVTTARMSVGYKAIRETFLSRVVCDRGKLAIDVSYLDGPFSHLLNQWRFIDEPDGGSTIDFYLEYKFRNFGLQMLMGSLFDKAFSKFAESFEARADRIYRK